MIEELTLRFVVAPGGPLPSAHDTVKLFTQRNEAYNVSIRRVLSQTPLGGDVVALRVLAERTRCGDDSTGK